MFNLAYPRSQRKLFFYRKKARTQGISIEEARRMAQIDAESFANDPESHVGAIEHVD